MSHSKPLIDFNKSPNAGDVNTLITGIKSQEIQMGRLEITYLMRAMLEFPKSPNTTVSTEESDMLPDVARCLQQYWVQVNALMSELEESVNQYGDQAVKVSLQTKSE